MAQSLRPVADVTIAGRNFVVAPWFSKLDDESDATFITDDIPASPSLCFALVRVTTIPDEPESTGDTELLIRVRANNVDPAWSFFVRIYNGASILGNTQAYDASLLTPDAWTGLVFTWTDLDWSTVDLADVRVWIQSALEEEPQEFDISRIELTVPDPVAASADGTPENVQVVCGMEDCGVTWDRPDDPDGNPVTGYEIERCDGESGDCMDEEDFTKVGETDAPDETSFDDDNPPLPPIDPDTVPSPTGEPYCYRVRSILTVGFSPYSDIVCATSTPRVYGNNAAILTEPARGPYTRYRGKPTSYN